MTAVSPLCQVTTVPFLAHWLTQQKQKKEEPRALTKDVILISDAQVASCGHLMRLVLDCCEAMLFEMDTAGLDTAESKTKTETESKTETPSQIQWFQFPIEGERLKSRSWKAQLEDWLLSTHPTKHDVVLHLQNGSTIQNELLLLQSWKTKGLPSRTGCVLLGSDTAETTPLPISRQSILVAVGGGVIGDLVGFVGATLMRGLKVIQIPTTLLAMIDSSIGGKTAIDVPAGKNLIGAFHQPSLILCGVAYLETLPVRPLMTGLAEMVKTAVIWDRALFERLEEVADVLVQVDSVKRYPQIWLELIQRTAGIKVDIVNQDVHEQDLRALLNFGHTLGHALETLAMPRLMHGEAVAVGMVLEAELSRHLGYLGDGPLTRLTQLLTRFALPTHLHHALIPRERVIEREGVFQEWLGIMGVDKKSVGGRKRVVLLKGIGETVELGASWVSDGDLLLVLAESVRVFPFVPWGGKQKEEMGGVAEIQPPGSKSISNRALLLAFLGQGTCRITNLLHSDDTQYMLQALRLLSGRSFYRWEEGGNTLVVEGTHGSLAASTPSSSPTVPEVFLGNAGTAARFLTVASFLFTQHPEIILTGNDRMKQRPLRPLVDALLRNGCTISYLEKDGCLPIRVKPAGFRGGVIRLSASISSQYVSAVLMAAPLADADVTLELISDDPSREVKVISESYIEMTLKMMQAFGIEYQYNPSTKTYFIPRQHYKNPSHYAVEPDASSATYPLAFAAMTGQPVQVRISRDSMQGDAQFAQVLERMGCSIERTQDFIRIWRSPDTPLVGLGEIDMEPMTDAFLTLAVVAALAKGETVIRGVANQRVKECNRIHAMMAGLAAFGVPTRELSDGLMVEGVGVAGLRVPPNGVECFDDHRVAMSFSLLAAMVPENPEGVLIHDKRCVEKTWPAWWDVLKRDLKTPVVGCERVLKSADSKQKRSPQKGIVLIGMRGVGKTQMGRALAAKLNRPFMDMDQLIADRCNVSTATEVIRQKGWEHFRNVETEVLADILSNSPALGFPVISTGGGVVEAEINRKHLSEWKHGIVIHLRRPWDQVRKFLESDGDRAAFSESLDDVWNRRQPLYDSCAHTEFEIFVDHSKITWKHMEEGLYRFVLSITSRDSNDFAFLNNRSRRILSQPGIDGSRATHFISLTYSNLIPHIHDLHEIATGCDAIELRVDLLESLDPQFIRQQISILRSFTEKPIIYTVRTAEQGGKFPVNGEKDRNQLKGLLILGSRTGCEFVDVELSLYQRKSSLAYDILSHPKLPAGCLDTTMWIGSYHHICQEADRVWHDGRMAMLFSQAADELDRISIIKLISCARNFQDNVDLFSFLSSDEVQSSHLPLIALNMGEVGSITRVLNFVLTPITHARLSVKAAPGQLTLEQIQRSRQEFGLLKSLQFFVVGSNIQYSKSPALHNFAFKYLGLPHVYSIADITEESSFTQQIKDWRDDPNFGGASITIPWKETAIKCVDEINQVAKEIGAINTLEVFVDQFGARKLRGTNTDWLGIKNSIQNCMSFDKKNSLKILVLGAGGTAKAACYAARHLCDVDDTQLFLWNRSPERAQILSHSFGAKILQSAENFTGHVWDVVISTVPGKSQEELPAFIHTIFTQESSESPIFLDMAYDPIPTHFMKLASQSKWKVVTGLDVLVEQAMEQSLLWTGRWNKCMRSVFPQK